MNKLLIAALLALSVPAAADPDPFLGIAAVLQSPRCMNCHPSGDAPLQTDFSRPHKQKIKRLFSSLGGDCSTCHQDTNLPGAHLPPGAPHWSMPPAATPMVFQGKTPAKLCADLKDTAQNGNRSLAALLTHVSSDPLVLWGFNPGPNRSTPPLTHSAFVTLFTDWVTQGGPCP
jgi:hypothetical protein